MLEVVDAQTRVRAERVVGEHENVVVVRMKHAYFALGLGGHSKRRVL